MTSSVVLSVIAMSLLSGASAETLVEVVVARSPRLDRSNDYNGLLPIPWATDVWQVSRDTVDEIERNLRQLLQEYRDRDPRRAKAVGSIDARLHGRWRQYVGLKKGAEQLVLITSAGIFAPPRPDSPMVDMFDGGDTEWRMIVDLRSHRVAFFASATFGLSPDVWDQQHKPSR